MILIQSRDSPKATLAPIYTFLRVHYETQFRIVIIATKDFLMWIYVIKPNHINPCFHSLHLSIKLFFSFFLTALTWVQLIITTQTFFFVEANDNIHQDGRCRTNTYTANISYRFKYKPVPKKKAFFFFFSFVIFEFLNDKMVILRIMNGIFLWAYWNVIWKPMASRD